MPCKYLPFTYMQAFSYSFPVQTVCACYVHSRWLLVWVLIILFDDDLQWNLDLSFFKGMEKTNDECGKTINPGNYYTL